PVRLVVGGGAANEVEILGVRLLGDGLDPQPLRPRGALRPGKAVGIALALDGAQRILGLFGEAALLEDQAAAHVDDLGDVLYEHRAGLLAGTTGNAGPDLLLLDRPTNQFLGNSLPLGGKLFRISLPLAG